MGFEGWLDGKGWGFRCDRNVQLLEAYVIHRHPLFAFGIGMIIWNYRVRSQDVLSKKLEIYKGMFIYDVSSFLKTSPRLFSPYPPTPMHSSIFDSGRDRLAPP